MDLNNQNLVEECFRRARLFDDLSASSIIKYRDSIKKFFSIIPKNFEDLEIRDFEDFITIMQDGGASNSRIANIISAVKWLINNLQINDMIEKSLDLEKVKKPKIGKRGDVAYLTEEEIRRLLEAVRSDSSKGPDIRKVRFEALIIFLLQTGARIGEVLSIDAGDIDRQNMEVNIIGKGNKPRTLFLTDGTLDCLDRYLAMRNDGHKALFVALNGKSRWSQTDVGRSFRRYKELSGIKKKFVVHTFRHTFATQYLMKGVGINVVQTALGHSDAVTTLKYYAGAVNKNKVREVINDRHFDFIPKSALENLGPMQ